MKPQTIWVVRTKAGRVVGCGMTEVRAIWHAYSETQSNQWKGAWWEYAQKRGYTCTEVEV